jgi:hypothetical protein
VTPGMKEPLFRIVLDTEINALQYVFWLDAYLLVLVLLWLLFNPPEES